MPVRKRRVATEQSQTIDTVPVEEALPTPVLQSGNAGRGMHEWIEIMAGWLVFIVSLPFTFFSAILGQFVSRGSSGSRIIGAILFFMGVFFSADSIWQSFFNGVALFPWFESRWIGFSGWLIVWLSPVFWASVAISICIQVVESKAVRGKSPDKARAEFEALKGYTLPQKPTGGIDLVKSAWSDYKKAGMGVRRQSSIFVAIVWFADFASAFVARNPFAQEKPGMIVLLFLLNWFSVMAGEYGYSIWKELKE